MKKVLFALLLMNCSLIMFAQKKQLNIKCNFPSSLKQNDYKELTVRVENNLQKEATGNLTFEIFNPEKNISVDGWFLNVFPFQYFTATPQKIFETKFPFTVPGDYKGKIKIVIKAVCGNAKDSVYKIISIP